MRMPRRAARQHAVRDRCRGEPWVAGRPAARRDRAGTLDAGARPRISTCSARPGTAAADFRSTMICSRGRESRRSSRSRSRASTGIEVEAFLTKPADLDAGVSHASAHRDDPRRAARPAGSGFNHKAQVYAAHGYATLMVNYRGSTGYGQKLADAIFKDQNGGEAKDVLAGGGRGHRAVSMDRSRRASASREAATAVSSPTG